MNSQERFLIGGGGALMPVIVSLLAIDIGAVLDSDAALTAGNIVGLFIRYIILFIIGGFVAYLHVDETKPFKLFEFGIAAPALITLLITAQGFASFPQQPAHNIYSNVSIISTAYAGTGKAQHSILLASSFVGDVLRGATGDIYRDINYSRKNKLDHTDIRIEPEKKQKSTDALRPAPTSIFLLPPPEPK